jgi:hypothetical protein
VVSQPERMVVSQPEGLADAQLKEMTGVHHRLPEGQESKGGLRGAIGCQQGMSRMPAALGCQRGRSRRIESDGVGLHHPGARGAGTEGLSQVPGGQVLHSTVY